MHTSPPFRSVRLFSTTPALLLLSFLGAVFLATLSHSQTFLTLVLFFFLGLCPLLHLFTEKYHGHRVEKRRENARSFTHSTALPFKA